jgi:uncharacterized RDD family membrane protein YckC
MLRERAAELDAEDERMTDLQNPYAPPNADVAPPPVVAVSLVDVARSRRIVHVIVDQLLVEVALSVAVVLAGDAPNSRDGGERYAVSALLSMVYYVFFEFAFGRTPGKFLTGSRVVALDGRRPTFGQVLRRTLTRFVPFDAVSFLGGRRGWHDEWSKTRVISVRG